MVDIYLSKLVDAQFSPTAQVEMKIPPFVEITRLDVQRVLYYISGCILSSIRKAEYSTLPCFHLSSFIIVTHLLPRRMDDFLFTWCDTRDKGSLMFAKQPLFDLICTIEHGYAKLLTLSNVSKCAGSSD